MLGQANAAITHLKVRRLKRKAKVAAVMQALPDGSMDDWVARIYDDVPSRMWPVAQRSLLARVLRLRALGEVS